MKKITESRFQAIGLWTVIFYIIFAVIFIFAAEICDMSPRKFLGGLFLGIFGAAALSAVFYFAGLKLFVKHKDRTMLLREACAAELQRDGRLSRDTEEKLLEIYNAPKNACEKNDAIIILADSYNGDGRYEEAVGLLRNYDINEGDDIKWAVSEKIKRVTYLCVYISSLMETGDIKTAEIIYNNNAALINEFMDEGDFGAYIRCVVAEYCLYHADGQSALGLVEKLPEITDKSADIGIMCVKAMAFAQLRRFVEADGAMEAACRSAATILQKRAADKCARQLEYIKQGKIQNIYDKYKEDNSNETLTENA
ncbi:MAG: hypothetical protein ACI4JF_01600 [Oscillospiraceae bacterium]